MCTRAQIAKPRPSANKSQPEGSAPRIGVDGVVPKDPRMDEEDHEDDDHGPDAPARGTTGRAPSSWRRLRGASRARTPPIRPRRRSRPHAPTETVTVRGDNSAILKMRINGGGWRTCETGSPLGGRHPGTPARPFGVRSPLRCRADCLRRDLSRSVGLRRRRSGAADLGRPLDLRDRRDGRRRAALSLGPLARHSGRRRWSRRSGAHAARSPWAPHLHDGQAVPRRVGDVAGPRGHVQRSHRLPSVQPAGAARPGGTRDRASCSASSLSRSTTACRPRVPAGSRPRCSSSASGREKSGWSMHRAAISRSCATPSRSVTSGPGSPRRRSESICPRARTATRRLGQVTMSPS